jgi:catechol 2,3-dioxygenase-like lactoylglutathione lyase family enzyme
MLSTNAGAEEPRVLSTDPISPMQLAHLVLRTPNYARMCNFYKTFLNARAAFEDDFTCFLRYDAEHHRMVIVNTPQLSLPDSSKAGLAHFAFTYRTLGELLGNYQRLQLSGIEPCWCINHGFTTSFYYYDPDGTLVETQYDNMDTEDADAFMRSDYFQKNPIGVDFDPELLIERFLRGDPMNELLKQGSALFPPDIMPVRPKRVRDYDYRQALLTSAPGEPSASA